MRRLLAGTFDVVSTALMLVGMNCCGTISLVTAQTETICQDLLTDYATCLVDQFDSQNDAALCDECRIEYSNIINNTTSVLSCEDIERVQCTAVQECPCQDCTVALEAYLNCEVINYNNSECSSGIDCRTSIVNCLNSLDEYRNCIYRLPVINDTALITSTANGRGCDDCRLQVAANFVNGGSCDMAGTNFCTGVTETCVTVCGDCIDELDFYYTCDVFDKSNGNCQLDCGTVSTPPISDELLCDNELTDFALCVTMDISTESERVACDTCRLDAEASIIQTSMVVGSTSSGDVTCTNVQEVICNEAIPTCADVCGTCIASLADYWICDTSKRLFLECSSTNCNLSSPSNTQPISIAPTFVSPTTMSPPTTPLAPTVDLTSQTLAPRATPISTPILRPTVSPQESTTTTTSATQVIVPSNLLVSLLVILYTVWL
jgi:hypothetical protein